ncbi:hypothetical protein [Anaerosporobacter sp.]|uniref:hypothetical protein n=1 Tax=Anaerosporobacter sp. TaxID=1872529 RepID=UPI00286EB728|nr:hypothetical protein [Anaerosporobacter sp.]
MTNLKSILKECALKTGEITLWKKASAFCYCEVPTPTELLKLKQEITKKTA